MEKIPEESTPLPMGELATLQVFPASTERNTRAALPPVANQTLTFPSTVRQLPLAANAPSPSMAGGSDWAGIAFQVLPPSLVVISSKLPFTGSPTAIP